MPRSGYSTLHRVNPKFKKNYFNQISALIYLITKHILIELEHIYMVSQYIHTSIFLYHC